MDCALILTELVGYHFATLENERRAEIDTHLLACPSCLRAYLQLKHDLDAGEDAAIRPSPGARDRLRAAVQREIDSRGTLLATARGSSFRRFLDVRVPLYQTLAAAALAVLATLVIPRFFVHASADDDLAVEIGPRVDTSRAVPVSELLY